MFLSHLFMQVWQNSADKCANANLCLACLIVRLAGSLEAVWQPPGEKQEGGNFNDLPR